MCTKETVYKISNLFDSLIKDKEIFKEILKGNNIEIHKDYFNDVYVKYKDKKKDLPNDVLGSMEAEGIYDNGGLVSKLIMFRELVLNSAYFYNYKDVIRFSDYGGIVGDKKEYASTEIVHQPTCTYNFKDIAEVRDEYKELIPNHYKKIVLPSSFSKIIENEDYKEFFKNAIEKGYSVNSIHEDRGGVFCRNRMVGYSSIDKLKGIEYDFYNDLLELVVGLGQPVKRVYFYSDLKWSCILYRPCKDAEGEYEIVIK